MQTNEMQTINLSLKVLLRFYGLIPTVRKHILSHIASLINKCAKDFFLLKVM